MTTLGLVETKSIAAGVQVADQMMKQAEVSLVRAGTICSGRYLIHVAGEREDVKIALSAARESGVSLAGFFLISNISSQVLAALKGRDAAEKHHALGLVECRTASSGIAGADAAVKAAGVILAKLVTGQGIMGKSYFVLAGELASVEAGNEAAVSCLKKHLINTVVIPSPDESVMKALINIKR